MCQILQMQNNFNIIYPRNMIFLVYNYKFSV